MAQVSFHTLQEVSTHDGRNGARTWIVVYDMVYDVTEYKSTHPGGPELIDEFAGMDATRGFDDFGHSSDAKKIMKDYFIGELVEEDKAANRKKKIVKSKNIAKTKEESQGRRTFLGVLCGGCTTRRTTVLKTTI